MKILSLVLPGVSGRGRECLCPRASSSTTEAGPGAGARRRRGKAAVRGARHRLTAQARITACSRPGSGHKDIPWPAEPPGSGSNGTAGPVCVAAAASRGLNKLVRSQNVSSPDGRRDSSRLYDFLATLSSLRAVSTTISCPAPISSKAGADRRRRPPSLGGCFRPRTAAAPVRSGPSALRSSASCPAGVKAAGARPRDRFPPRPPCRVPRPTPGHGRSGKRGSRTAPRTELHPTSPSRPAFALHIHEAAAPDWRNCAPAASHWPARPPLTRPRLLPPAVTHQGVEQVPQRSPRPPPAAGRGAAPAPRSLFRPLQAPWTSWTSRPWSPPPPGPRGRSSPSLITSSCWTTRRRRTRRKKKKRKTRTSTSSWR